LILIWKKKKKTKTTISRSHLQLPKNEGIVDVNETVLNPLPLLLLLDNRPRHRLLLLHQDE
jgi:hypothetical protein